MESQRQQKFARLLQKDLAEIFQQDRRHDFNNAFITITNVKVSPDLGVANVYLSFMLVTNKNQLLEQIRDKAKVIRNDLGHRIRHQARVIPELRFFLDETAEEAERIHKLMEGLNIPPDPDKTAEEKAD